MSEFKFGDKVNVGGRNGIFRNVSIFPKKRRVYVIVFPKGVLAYIPEVVKRGWKQ